MFLSSYATNFYQYLSRILALFIVLPIHESAHALMAYWLGDKTAKWEGRLSLNPMRHLSLWGSLALILIGFGWANPVPINCYNFKKVKDPKVGFALCALAGPLANFLLAIVTMIIFKILLVYGFKNAFLTNLLLQLTLISIYLMVFNLLPIPPLDGSRILSVFLKDETYHKLLMYENIIMIAVFFLISTRILSEPIMFMSHMVISFIDLITWFIK